MIPTRARAWLVLGVAAPLAACINLTPRPPAMLLTLQSAEALAPGAVQSSGKARSITLRVPNVPAALAGPRIPVQSGANAIAYVKGAVWAEPPGRLFARLLIDTLGARAGRIVLSFDQSFADPGAHLSGELRRFDIDADRHEAVVIYDATLMRDGARDFERRRFEARAPVSAIDPERSAAALNRAANMVAAQVADWVGA